MTDQEIINLIRAQKEDKAFVKLYKNQRAVVKYIKSKGGSTEDAQDVFQEALLVFHQKCKKPDFMLTSSIATYLFSVARFLCSNQLSKKGISTANLLNDDFFAEFNNDFEQEAAAKIAEQAIKQLGQQCRRLLTLFYLETKKNGRNNSVNGI